MIMTADVYNHFLKGQKGKDLYNCKICHKCMLYLRGSVAAMPRSRNSALAVEYRRRKSPGPFYFPSFLKRPGL